MHCLHHSRGPSMSSQCLLLDNRSACMSIAQRLSVFCACCRWRASSSRLHHGRDHGRLSSKCAAQKLPSQQHAVVPCCGVMTVKKSSRLFNLALPARKAFLLADALRRAAFAAPSKW